MKKPKPEKVYLVTSQHLMGATVCLVRATSKEIAREYAAINLDVRIATQDDIVRCRKWGIEIEDSVFTPKMIED